MFESNVPVDKESGTYHTLWNSLKRVAQLHGLTATEKAAAFYDTAVRVYKLDAPSSAVVAGVKTKL